eukprot:SAG31_NODE_26815_length_436_cov_0.682493_1_plen_54_part_00
MFAQVGEFFAVLPAPRLVQFAHAEDGTVSIVEEPESEESSGPKSKKTAPMAPA